jgi:hypothetical protein
MAFLTRDKFNLQKVSFRNLLLLFLATVVLGLIGLIAKVIAKNDVSFGAIGQAGLKAFHVSEAQALNCWDLPAGGCGCVVTEACGSQAGPESGESGESGEAGCCTM